MRKIKEAVRDGMEVIMVVLAVLMCIGMFSCSTTKKTAKKSEVVQEGNTMTLSSGSDLFTHFSIQELSAEKVVIYDTSLAVDTIGGFYAPVIAEIERNSNRGADATLVKRDTIYVTMHDTVFVNIEKEAIKTHDDRSGIVYVIMFVIVIIIGFILKRKIFLHFGW